MLPSSNSYKSAVLAPSRQTNSRVTITMNALNNGNPQVFDDNRVISANIIEEISILNLTSPANQLLLTLDNTDNLFSFLTLNNIHTIIASRPSIKVEFGIVLEDAAIEWIPMGTFYVDSWKNDTGSMTITFTAHDYLMILGNTSFDSTAITTANALAVAIFQNAGITNYWIDPSVESHLGYNRMTWSTNSRDLLQHLAILTGTTLYQDRYGVVKLEKFPSILESQMYTLHVSSQNGLYHYVSPNTYEEQSTEGGMRSILMDNMFEIPSVTLDQSIYQVNINVYSTDPLDDNFTTYTYTNPNLGGGRGGMAFTLDIPMVTSTASAKVIAARMFAETMYNAVYVARWRQNPIMVATDIVIIDDSNNTMKQTRVTKQEFQYKGYLSGTTESRGGV